MNVYIKLNKYIVKFTNFQSSYSFLIHRVSDTVNINTYFSQQNHKIVFFIGKFTLMNVKFGQQNN